jgi:hypothetical protein
MRGFAILVIAAAIYCGAHDAVLAQTSTPNVVSPPGGLSTPLTSTPRDVLQRSGGELSNRLLHPRAAHGCARRNCDLEPDNGVRDGLLFEAARVSGRMRAGFPFAIGAGPPHLIRVIPQISHGSNLAGS